MATNEWRSFSSLTPSLLDQKLVPDASVISPNLQELAIKWCDSEPTTENLYPGMVGFVTLAQDNYLKKIDQHPLSRRYSTALCV